MVAAGRFGHARSAWAIAERKRRKSEEIMIRIGCLAGVLLLAGSVARAQDVPGIELCTHESRMEQAHRLPAEQCRLICKKLIAKTAADAQQKLNAAASEIGALKAAVATLQASRRRPSGGRSRPAGEPRQAAGAGQRPDAPASNRTPSEAARSRRR